MSDFFFLAPLLLLFIGLPIAVTIFNVVRVIKRFEEKMAIFPVADIFSTVVAFIYLLLYTAAFDEENVLFTLPAAAAVVLYLIAFFFKKNCKPLLTVGCVLMIASTVLLLLNPSYLYFDEKWITVLPCINYLMVSEILINKRKTEKTEALIVNKNTKIKFMLYILFTAVSFFFLITPAGSALGYLMFTALQTAAIAFLLPKKRAALWFIPALVLSANRFISANGMFSVANIFVTAAVYSLTALAAAGVLEMRKSSFALDIVRGAIEPCRNISLPFIWTAALRKDADSAKIKKVLIGLLISLPCVIILIAVLSNADTVFQNTVDSIIKEIKNINFTILFKIIISIAAALYLFCIVFEARVAKKHEYSLNPRGDATIINILLLSLSAVYTVFIVIQFTYLFAGRVPEGMSYSSYARRGFFELLFLSIVNILLILLCISLTKEQPKKARTLTRICCFYLCAVTVVLAASSFYRMWLYSDSDGLTRLRFLVFGFLIFEAAGLLLTFYYIVNPRFNIIGFYAALALCYYLLLNVVPLDYFIAKNQVDRYLAGSGNGLEYAFTLSEDADPQLVRLKDREELKELLSARFSRRNVTGEKDIRKLNLSKMRSHSFYVY